MMARPASGMWSKPSTANASIRVLLPEPGPPVMTWKSGRTAIARTFRFRVERALAPPLPDRQHIASVVALNARCTLEQRAGKGGPILDRQPDQTGFLDEAAQPLAICPGPPTGRPEGPPCGRDASRRV